MSVSKPSEFSFKTFFSVLALFFYANSTFGITQSKEEGLFKTVRTIRNAKLNEIKLKVKSGTNLDKLFSSLGKIDSGAKELTSKFGKTKIRLASVSSHDKVWFVVSGETFALSIGKDGEVLFNGTSIDALQKETRSVEGLFAYFKSKSGQTRTSSSILDFLISTFIPFAHASGQGAAAAKALLTWEVVQSLSSLGMLNVEPPICGRNLLGFLHKCYERLYSLDFNANTYNKSSPAERKKIDQNKGHMLHDKFEFGGMKFASRYFERCNNRGFFKTAADKIKSTDLNTFRAKQKARATKLLSSLGDQQNLENSLRDSVAFCVSLKKDFNKSTLEVVKSGAYPEQRKAIFQANQ